MDDLARRKFTGRFCNTHLDKVTAHAVEVALKNAETALAQGRLLNPSEAMAIALGYGKGKETLFSIARTVAWELGADQDDILAYLGERYPNFA